MILPTIFWWPSPLIRWGGPSREERSAFDGVADRADDPELLDIKELVVGGAAAGFEGDIHA